MQSRMIFPLILICQFLFAQFEDSIDPKTRIDYWLNNYSQVTSGEDYGFANLIFEKILAVADKPVGVLPSLYIFSNLKFNQLFATRDGAIILPLKVLHFCRKDRSYAEARLAFLLGHEIKHIVRGDYELINNLIRFIEEIGHQESENDFSEKWEKLSWGPSLERRRNIENQADAYGILYSSLAGFDVSAIISPENDFISEYYRFAGLDADGGIVHPSSEERTKTIQQRILSILDFLDLFNYGLRFYAIGEYDAAIDLLTKFATQYPSREVFNNRGMCYYQKALLLFSKWQPDDVEENPNFTFKLSAQIDPVSRLVVTSRAIQPELEKSVQQTIDLAISDFRKAEQLDIQYPVVYNNLGCVHLLKGELGFARDYFKKAINLNPSYQEAVNNLGVCYAAEGEGEKAEDCFLDAARISPTYKDPIFNLGRLYTMVNRTEEARSHLERYLKMDRTSGYSEKSGILLGKPLQPTAAKCIPELIENYSPQNVQIPLKSLKSYQTSNAAFSSSHDENKRIGFCFYRTRQPVKTISLICTEKSYPGQTAKSIKIGDPGEILKTRYPCLKKEIPTIRGSFWVYKDIGMVFEMIYGKVGGWFLFDVY